jgi:sterol 3beta-glucosyltransferase
VKILLLTAGTRGDVEPFAVLAGRALEAGHTVRLGVPDNSGVDLAGLDTASLDIDFRPLIESQGISALLAVRAFRTHIRPAMARLLQRALELMMDWGPEVVLAHPKVLTAPLGAAHLRVPCYWVETVPSWTPTTAFPAPGITLSGPGPVNRLTYRLVQAAGTAFRGEVAGAARATGVDPVPGPATAGSFVPASPQILARPPDWPATTHLTGAWTRREAGDLPPEVRAFAEAGPFLYAGFGSMAAGDPQARARAIIDAARHLNLRTLIATGWGGLSVPEDRRGPDVMQVPTVDHSALLPLACVAVHHGGAGTAHAAVAAGIPSVVVPFVADQPFWARQLAHRGLAPAPLPQRRLTTDRLTRALTEALELRDTAARVGALLRAEDGPATTLGILETELGTPGTHP